MSGDSTLEVVYIGELPRALSSFFQKHGVVFRLAEPDPKLAFVPTGNTLLGAISIENTDRVLLVDNDIVFMSNRMASHNVPDDTLAGAIAGVLRVDAKQWDIIEKEIGLPTMPGGQIVDQSRLVQLRNPSAKLVQFPRLYINGGVLLLPKDPSFVEKWRHHILLINDHFKGGKFETEAVCRSNMAGLATAAAEHGKFEWLEPGANFRHFHFVLNACPIDAISVLHMTGDTRAPIPKLGKFDMLQRFRNFWQRRTMRTVKSEARGQTTQFSKSHVSDYVELYWRNRILGPLSALEVCYAPTDYSDARATALAALDRLHRYVRDYELDEIMHDTIAEISTR